MRDSSAKAEGDGLVAGDDATLLEAMVLRRQYCDGLVMEVETDEADGALMLTRRWWCC